VARHRSPWTASWLGLVWGLGHSATIVAVGACAVALRVAVPEPFAAVAELGVGVLLVLLGAANLAAAAAASRAAAREAAPRGLRGTLARSGLLGMAHGLAGSAALALLATAAMPTREAAIVYLLVFALGSVAGMVAFSLALGLPAASLSSAGGGRRALAAATGLVSLACGAAVIQRSGALQGLWA
jgi:high-affinity nickel-transport protein